MGDLAPNVENDLLTVEGFEDFLVEQEPGSAQGLAEALEGEAEAEHSPAQGLASGVPVEEAARRLGITTNAVLKRLRRGKLQGQKVQGHFGEHWLVDVSSVPEPIEIELEAEPGLASGSAQATSDSTKDEPGSAQGSASTVPDRERDLLQLVVHLSKENGALQALLTEREKQIKLLTDSNYEKPTGLSRFWGWFIGR